jgi:uncharacterized protein YegJ (DUF2314 family)
VEADGTDLFLILPKGIFCTLLKIQLMKTFITLCLLAMYLPAFCQSDIALTKNYQAIKLTKDDSTFLALKDTAQKHLNIFIDSVTEHGKDTANYRFGIKSEFVEKDKREHMWSQVSVYDKGNFKGVFIDSAFEIKKIKKGDKVNINQLDVEDWIIVNKRNGKRTGYYSEAYLNKKEY